ncbi:MAG: hypothetical protein WEA75_01885 [Acidimicrobiia bacterium]
MPKRSYSRAERRQMPIIRGPNDAVEIIKQLVCDEHTEGQLLIGIDDSMRLSGAAFNCPCDVCQERTAGDAGELVALADEMDATDLVLVTFVDEDRLAPTAADVARFEGLRVECLDQGVALLDHLLFAGHCWRSIAEVGLSAGPGASTTW